MDSETLRVVVIAAMGIGGAVWLLSTFLFRVTGTWERVLTQDELDDGARAERITLGQLGPLVTGRRDVKGGHQEYWGLMFGRRLTLTRRDHGKKALVAMGFPEGVAEKLDGEIMARMKLSLADGGLTLEGTFEPQKVEFTHQPPRITRVFFLPGQRRRYRRVESVADRVPALDEVEPSEV
jgi:hypothetical protein